MILPILCYCSHDELMMSNHDWCFFVGPHRGSTAVRRQGAVAPWLRYGSYRIPADTTRGRRRTVVVGPGRRALLLLLQHVRTVYDDVSLDFLLFGREVLEGPT